MKIGLALSGGGALGAAHIGALEEMEKRGVGFDRICGTSAGAIIGLLYADGGLDAVHAFLHSFKASGMLASPFSLIARTPRQIFTHVRDVLDKTVRVSSFDELAMTFSCVATDIATGEMVVMDKGDPVAAVMASASYPGVLEVQKLNGRLLIDGGATRNLPADILRQQGAEFVIGSSVYALAELKVDKGRAGLSRIRALARAFEIMQSEMSRLQIEKCDFCFIPPVQAYAWYDFADVDAILEIGRRHARKRVGELMRLLDKV